MELKRIEDLAFHLDLKKEDTVFISSDFKKIALDYKAQKKHVDLNEFIINFQKVLENGTLIIPAYTDNFKTNAIFDVKKSKPTTGALSNHVYKRKDFQRTLEPIHSVFVWGKNTQEILSLQDESTFGENSIFSYLLKKDAKFIFIDVHIVNSFTFIHHIEEKMQVPYRRNQVFSFKIIDSEGKIIQKKMIFHTKKWGIQTNFDKLNKNLLQENKMKEIEYKTIPILSTSAKKTTLVVEKMLLSKEFLYQFNLKHFFYTLIKQLISKFKAL